MRHQHFKSSRFWREDVHWDYDIGIFYFQKNITKCSVEVKSAAFITWVALLLNGSYVTKLHYYLLLHCLLIGLYYLVCILVFHAEKNYEKLHWLVHYLQTKTQPIVLKTTVTKHLTKNSPCAMSSRATMWNNKNCKKKL